MFSCVASILGDEGLGPEDCLVRLDIRITGQTAEAVQHVMALSQRSAEDSSLGTLFESAIDLFPHYYRVLEEILSRVSSEQ